MARRKTPETEAPDDPATQPPEPVAETESVSGAAAETPALAEEAPAPDPRPAPPQSAADAQGGPGFLGPILGGALAAVAGFALSHFNAFGVAVQDSSAAVAAMASRIAVLESAPAPEPADLSELDGNLAALQSRIAALEATPAPPAPDLSALETLDRRLAAIEAMPTTGDASTAALAAKLAELERRLASLPTAEVDLTKVEAALARLEAAEAEATARATAATEAAAAAARATALDRLRTVARTDAAFDAELAALDDPALTAALSPHAAGVATLANLQADFPELVRAALELARAAEGEQGWGARVIDFLARQTGARPLTPQDGATPAAILSRADFAVTEGRLAEALTEIAALPPDVQAIFADWSARANARLAVDSALEAP